MKNIPHISAVQSGAGNFGLKGWHNNVYIYASITFPSKSTFTSISLRKKIPSKLALKKMRLPKPSILEASRLYVPLRRISRKG